MNTRAFTDLAADAITLSRLSSRDASAFRVASTVTRLRRLGNEARTHAESLCNRGERTEGEDSKKRDSISRRAFAALAEIMPISGVRIEVHGDPRGSCLQIWIPNGAVACWTFTISVSKKGLGP